ncbi:MAG: hypothetical protein JWO05_3679 [Gemmatimonadetes bacterium]|nr:hypothetical protein [Gemmatimonadota bacterium]
MATYTCLRHCATLAALVLGGSARARSQSPALAAASVSVDVGPDRPLVADLPASPLVEPHLSASPSDPAHLLVGVTVVQSADNASRSCAALVSRDSGLTWARHDFATRDCGDAWTAFRGDGTAFISMLGSPSDSLSSLIELYSSADGGARWTPASQRVAGVHDHPTLAVARTGGTSSGAVYLTSEEQLRDADRHSRSALSVARADATSVAFQAVGAVIASSVAMTAMNAVVLSDGALVAAFSDYGRSLPDGGSARLSTSRDWMVTSRDGGATFAAPTLISESCGYSFPVLAADASATDTRDRLYWVCNTRAFDRIYLHASGDRGERWTDPMAVNGSADREPYVRTPSVAVNNQGIVAVSWYDARGTGSRYRGIYRCQNLWFTASGDGGRTFASPVKVSSAPNCPDTPGNGEAGRRWPAGGDYHGLAAGADGRFHLVWADSRSGVYQLRTATIRVSDSRAVPSRSP